MPLLALLSAFERALLLAPLLLDASRYPWIGNAVQQFYGQFTASASQFLTAVDSGAIQVARLAYVASLSAGAFLYLTRPHRGLGGELITGGVVLVIISEFVLPLVLRL